MYQKEPFNFTPSTTTSFPIPLSLKLMKYFQFPLYHSRYRKDLDEVY